MRQFNFFVLFAVLLGIALFAMQNATPSTVTLAPGLQFQSPLVLELILAAGLGAGIAWLYSLWTQMQFNLEAQKQSQELQEKEIAINRLKEMVVELESTVKQLPPSKRAEPATDEEEAEEDPAGKTVTT